jgi:hypothetical protein
VVPKNEAPSEILGDRLGAVVRGILAASVRAKVDLDLELAAQMSAVETRLLDRYRVRTETDVDAGIRYAVFPLCCRREITLLQDEPSAHAPCTRTTFAFDPIFYLLL